MGEQVEFIIDKGVDMPRNKSETNGRPSFYPWASMKEGDSFFAIGADSRKASSICSSGRSWLKKRKILNVSFYYRIVIEDGVKGARVWINENKNK